MSVAACIGNVLQHCGGSPAEEPPIVLRLRYVPGGEAAWEPPEALGQVPVDGLALLTWVLTSHYTSEDWISHSFVTLRNGSTWHWDGDHFHEGV